MYLANRSSLKNMWQNKKNEKKGSVTPLILGVIFVFFIGLTFLTIEVPIQRTNASKFNSFLTNIGTAAIHVANENGVSRGEHPQISQPLAEKTIYEGVEEYFSVHREATGVFKPSATSPLLKAPLVEYLIVNKPAGADATWSQVVTFKGKRYKINSSSVFVNLKVTYKDFMLMNTGLTLEKTVVNQIKRNGDLSIEDGPEG